MTTLMQEGAGPPRGVYGALRSDLVSGRWQAGEKLMPRLLAPGYHCAPGVLREALLRLASEGFVENAVQRGFRVVSPTPNSVWEIAHFRVLVETEGARLSIRNGDVTWEANLTAAHHRLTHLELRLRGTEASPEKTQLWSGYDRAFHEALIAACGSSLLKAQHRAAFDRFKQHVIAQDTTLGYRGEELVQEHTGILAAALDRDPDACAQALRRHFETFRRFSDAPMAW